MRNPFKSATIALAAVFAVTASAHQSYAVDAAAAAAAATKPASAVEKIAAVSPCKGLDEKSCGTKTACDWIVPKDANEKTGKLQAPYCRKKSGVDLTKPAAAPAGVAPIWRSRPVKPGS